MGRTSVASVGKERHWDRMSENESEKDAEATKEFSRRDSLGVFGREQAVRLTISSQAAISASIIAIFASHQRPMTRQDLPRQRHRQFVRILGGRKNEPSLSP